MTCRCDIEPNYGGVRRWCEACLQRVHDAGRVAAAAERIERAIGPQAKADQQLGAAVRATGVTPEVCEKLIRDLRNLRGSLTLSSSAYSRAYEMEISVFAAVADALRKETA